MATRTVTLVGGPHDGRTITLTTYRIDFPDEGWGGEGPMTVHTYSVRRDEHGAFFGRYDGSHPA